MRDKISESLVLYHGMKNHFFVIDRLFLLWELVFCTPVFYI